MPEYTYEDRNVLKQEQSLWVVVNILSEETGDEDTAWTKQIKELRDKALEIAREIKKYNDEFEVTD